MGKIKRAKENLKEVVRFAQALGDIVIFLRSVRI